MKLRNKKWLRVIAVTLAVALMMQMTPVGALSSEETIREADTVNETTAEITVETEIEDLRTETESTRPIRKETVKCRIIPPT